MPGQPRLTVRHTYNAAGFLAELTDVSSLPSSRCGAWTAATSTTHLTQGTYGNGLVTERSYDDLTGRLKELNGGAIYALAYSYDANGLVKSRADSVTARHETFRYDSLIGCALAPRARRWRSRHGIRLTTSWAI